MEDRVLRIRVFDCPVERFKFYPIRFYSSIRLAVVINEHGNVCDLSDCLVILESACEKTCESAVTCNKASCVGEFSFLVELTGYKLQSVTVLYDPCRIECSDAILCGICFIPCAVRKVISAVCKVVCAGDVIADSWQCGIVKCCKSIVCSRLVVGDSCLDA